MENILPLQVNNYSVWKDGSRFLGMANLVMPHIQNLTDSYKGAGYGGETAYPVQAHYNDWDVTFHFHAITQDSLELMRQDAVNVQVLSGIQYQNPSTHAMQIGAWKFSMIVLPKGFDIGTLDVGVKENVAILCGVDYIKATYNGKVMFEKDKVNMKDIVLGTDYAAPIRSAIGM